MAELSMTARRELVDAVRGRYREETAPGKRRILDEFVAVTGYHRKHAIRILNGESVHQAGRTHGRPRLYDEAVRQALVVLWEAADRICGKRLRSLLPVLLPALERHGHVHLATGVRDRLLAASAATIDRLLSGVKTSRVRRPRSAPAVRSAVAVRTFADWHDPVPGFLEGDLVFHCGERVSGRFASTLVMTDIASGWTECAPVLVREASVVVEALDGVRSTLPFTVKGIDTDNGSEFVNEVLSAFCTRHAIEFTRSRPYRKNDQAWVEQKNGAVVRRLVGYGRLEGVVAGEALSGLYAASRLFVNFLQPSFKLAEKHRNGARVTKLYHVPQTPCALLLARPDVDETMKECLRAVLATLDPLRLLDEIRTVQHHLAGLAAGDHRHVLPHRDADLEHFLSSLAHRRDRKPIGDAEEQRARGGFFFGAPKRLHQSDQHPEKDLRSTSVSLLLLVGLRSWESRLVDPR